jgi:hypothetical protein
MVAAQSMLDEQHNPLQQDSRDHNPYTLSRIGAHNIALACLSAGVTGTISAARMATQMLSTFKKLSSQCINFMFACPVIIIHTSVSPDALRSLWKAGMLLIS